MSMLISPGHAPSCRNTRRNAHPVNRDAEDKGEEATRRELCGKQ